MALLRALLTALLLCGAVRSARAAGPFEVTPAMEAWAAEAVRGCRGQEERLDCLQRAMFSPDFGFDYAGGRTTTAAEAFERREGNCFGFTALFLALSRSVGVPTELVQVPAVRDARQEEGLVVVSRHLAVLWRSGPRWVFYDFGQQAELPWRAADPVSDARGEAMFHNNRSLAALRTGDAEGAQAELEAAIAADPGWADAWVNLGVVRRQQGDLPGAYEAYARALELEAQHASALANLAWLYDHTGQRDARHRALVAASEANEATVFTLLSLARLQAAQGHQDKARRTLRRARWSRPGTPEVHEALAWWARMEGDAELAERHAQRAVRLRKEHRLRASAG